MKKILTILSVLLLLFPILASAQLSGTPAAKILQTIDDIVSYVAYMLMGVATVVFLWGMVKYVMAGGDEKAKESSKGIIKTGIIGLFFAVAIWGVVNILVKTFIGTENRGIPLGPGYEDPTQFRTR